MRDYRRFVILICEECGEKMVLEGSEATWRSESNPFECGCGEHLTLADQERAAASKAGRLAG
jgi:hypothetical protein